ncbi:MAG: SusC/RagA family TonB-linked outer membrane protein [Carboxylicivirga sp.]|jgi:TonB-linked SusC/RagA family outer membrane protein|nr:SusC/RagA family TonB-linked outer membrane protein [Carboxylicivirga sp.]
MRISIVLLMTVFIPLSATTFSQNQKIVVRAKNITLQELFKTIQDQSDYDFFYQPDELDQSVRVSFDGKKQEINDILDVAFSNTSLDYKILDTDIVILNRNSKFETVRYQQEVIITGTVTDENGDPLPGVNVFDKNNPTNGTITSIDGSFKLGVQSTDATIKFSFIGFDDQEINIAGREVINITMISESTDLNEVVVTALGIKREQKALSYNVQEVDSEELTMVKDVNLMNSLSGKLAGVDIRTSASGVGGATRVVMRGVKSISQNNNALYVIDGVPIFNINDGNVGGIYSGQPQGEGISDLNPEDIEKITVLTGPSAAALYGSNAAQGVILITTKKGKKGKVNVSVSNNTNFSEPLITPDFQTKYVNRPGEYKTWGGLATTPIDYDPTKFFQTGFNIQNNVSVSGGNDKNSSYLSLGSTNAEGILPNNTYERYNINFRNTTELIKDKLSIDVNVNYIVQKDANLMAQGEYFNPLITLYTFPRGEDFDDVRLFERYDSGRQIYTQHWPYGVGQNPYWIMNRMERTTDKDRYMLSGSVKYNITKDINVVGRVRMDNSISNYEEKRHASTVQLFADPKGFYRVNKSENKQLYGDLIFTLDKRINDFTINSNIGGSGSRLYSNLIGFNGGLKDIPNLFTLYNINLKDGRDVYPTQSGYEEVNFATFVNVETGWKSRIYLSLSGRGEWPSTLANTEKSGFLYGSVGLSGVISEMVDLPEFVSYTKVRASYASVGSAIPRGLSIPQYSYDVGTNKWKTQSYRPLPKLYPERTNSYEIGLQSKLFNGTVDLNLTYYFSDTKNQTFNIPVSASSGYSSMYIQSGNVHNEGIELSLGANVKMGQLTWSPTFTYSYNKNEITELLSDYVDPITQETYSIEKINKSGLGSVSNILTVGGSMGDIYATNELKRDNEGNIFVNPTTNNVERVNLTEPRKIGSVLPDGQLGLKNDFVYRNFSMGAMISARLGGLVVSSTQAVLDEYGVSQRSADLRDQGGIPINNGVVDVEKFMSVAAGQNGIMSDYVYDATIVRLQELYLGYRLPGNWFNNKMNMSVALIGRNLFMIYNKAPFDPESTVSTGTYYQGFDHFKQPSMKSYGFNVKVNF